MSVRPLTCHLTLSGSEAVGENVYLAYRWSEDLSHEQADQVDTCVRALINSKIGDIATATDISVRLDWGEESLIGVPIPLWFLDHRNQPTYVVNSQFDVHQKIIGLNDAESPQSPKIDDGPFQKASRRGLITVSWLSGRSRTIALTSLERACAAVAATPVDPQIPTKNAV